MRKIILTAMALTMLSTTAAYGAPCRNAKGKFIKCATAKVTAPVRCKDANGKFAKCGTAGAKPI